MINVVAAQAVPLVLRFLTRTFFLMWATMLACVVYAAPATAQDVDWLINASSDQISIPAGGTIEYVVSVGNNGNGPAASPETAIYFTVPVGNTLTSVTSGDVANPTHLDITNCRVVASGFGTGTALPATGGQRVVCDVPPLDLTPSVPAALTLQMLTSGTSPTVLPQEFFVADVSDGDGTIFEPGNPPVGQSGIDTSTTNNVAQVDVTVEEGSDLELLFTTPASAPAGSIIDFSLDIRNLGPNDTDSFTVEFTPPAGIGNLVLPPECTAGTPITCVISTNLVPTTSGASPQIQLNFSGQVQVPSDSDIRLNASVGGSTPRDPVASNNTPEAEIDITPGTDLFVGISSDAAGEVLREDIVTFTLSPGYTGDDPTDILITHEIPPNFTLDDINDIVAPGYTVTQVGNELRFELAAGSGPGVNVALPEITIPLRATTLGDDIVSTVSIETTGTPAEDPSSLGNNTASILTTIVEPTVDFDVDKTGPSPALAVVGQDYDFMLDAQNIGTAPFVGVVEMRDVIPATLQLNSVVLDGWDCEVTVGGMTTTLPGGLPALDAANSIELVCTREYTSADPLPADASLPTILYNVTPTEELTLTNSVRVSTLSGPILDLVGGNDTVDFELVTGEPGNSADITVFKTVIEDPLVAGEVQTYELEIVNLSTDGTASEDIVLTDQFRNLINGNVGPDNGYLGASFVDAGSVATGLVCSDGPSGSTGRLLTCTVASLAPCYSREDVAPQVGNPNGLPACPIVTVQVRHGTDLASIPNDVDVISNGTPDPNLGNQSDDTSFTQNRTLDLTISKTVDATMVPAGQDVTFTIVASVVDDGRANARDVIVTDTLPTGMRFISVSVGGGGSCSQAPDPFTLIEDTGMDPNNILICELGAISNGGQRTISVTLQATNDQRGETLTNTADVALGPLDVDAGTVEDTGPDAEPNSDSIPTTVLDPLTDLAITKTDTADPVVVLNGTSYIITVLNNGPSTSEDIVVTDTLPLVSPTTGAVVYDRVEIDAPGMCTTEPTPGTTEGTLICTYPLLAEDESFQIEVFVIGDARGDVRNEVEVSSFEILNGFDSEDGNNSTFEITSVNSRSDVSITKEPPADDEVALEENFEFTITVSVASGPGLDEAENVIVTDTLPAGMVLTGSPTTAYPGASCSGVAGEGGAFTCQLGTIPAGTDVVVTVPVEVLEYPTPNAAGPVGFTNSASVTTDTFNQSEDVSATAEVEVTSASIAGTIFRDFDNLGTQDLPTDTPIENAPVFLTGVSDDGETITRETTTDEDGNYIFEGLPGGTYEITRGDPPNDEPLLEDGIDTPGTVNGSGTGTTSGDDAIIGIVLVDETAGVDYDFAFTPIPTVGLVKDVTEQTVNADGTFNATFSVVVQNLSLERLVGLSVTDPLEGVAPLFGTYDGSLANPPTSAMTAGTYTVLTGPSNGCGGANASFTGTAAQSILASGFELDVDGSCTITFTLRIAPFSPLPDPQPGSGGQYENQATVQGTGEITGLAVADTSDDGTEVDPDGDRVADEAGENDPTPLSTEINPSIAIIKTADTSALSSPPAFGETITYRFQIRNTGNVTLTNITVDDILDDAIVSGTIASLAPGDTDTTTITATYALTEADLNAGEVINSATVTGIPPIGDPVTDTSGGDFTEDDPLVTPFDRAPSIELIKTADNSGVSDPPAVGDIITYSFEVRNTGNVTLTNVTIDDLLDGVNFDGAPITLGPVGTGTDVDTTTFTASYALTLTDLTNGEVVNVATATGTPPTGPNVTGDDTATVPLPSVGIAKQLISQVQNADGTVTASYNLVVENLGQDRLINLEVTDPLNGFAPGFGTYDGTLANPGTDPMVDGTYTIVTAPSAGCGPTNGGYDGAMDDLIATGFALDIGASCTITFTIRLAPPDPLPAINPVTGGRFDNQAFVTGEGEESGNEVGDTSDDGPNPDADGDNIANEPGENDPTPLNTGIDASIAIIKTADTSALSSPPALGETITYRFEIQNTGNVTLFNITVDDILDDAVVDGTIISLSPNAIDSTTITATYALTEADLDAGMIINQATVTGTPPVGDPVTDESGTDFDDDVPLETLLDRAPGIELIKTADETGLSDPPQVGETITYAFEVRNTGNVTLTNVTIADMLDGVVLGGGPITLGPAGSPTDTDTTTFTATYVLTPDDLEAGQVVNDASVTGTPPVGSVVTEVSDDADVTTTLTQAPGIELVKEITDDSALEDGAQIGDVISYGFTVTNTGNVPLRGVTITDDLVGVILVGNPIALMNPAAANDDTDVNTTITATYELTALDVANGGVVVNTATATGFYGAGLTLSVDDEDSVTARPPNPAGGLVLTKTTPDETVRRGTIVPYTISLRNDNPFPALGQTIVDTLPVGLVYVAESAELDGVPVTPTIVGRSLSFPPQDLAPGQEIVVTLLSRILNGTNPGSYTNEAIVLDPFFGLTAGPATATIRVLPEPIFDCGDVIGRVFDDLDGDGYQDAYTEEGIPEDPVEEHKIEDIVRELTQEVGLPGVRLVTLDGLVITTDANGLFSIPCAALPADRGSNFLVSLDERTLPLGYEMTTMNPRVLRLTPGVLTEMNFGARLSQMMRVDLNAQAFAGANGLPTAVRDGIAAMVARLAEERSRIALVYHVPADASATEVAAGRASMGLVQTEIARQWSQIGNGRLRIEQTIARGGN